MKRSLFYLFFWLVCGASMNVAATVDAPNFRSVSWDERTYKTALSRSFGDITVNVSSQGDGEVKSILIEMYGRKMLVPLEYLVGIEQLSEPDLAITNEGGRNEELRIFFEYGAPIRVEVDSSSDWVRQVLTIAIDREGNIEVSKKIPGSIK